MRRPLLASFVLATLACPSLAAQSSTRLTASLGAMSAYGSTGPMGTFGVGTALGTSLRIGADIAVGRTALESSPFIHRAIVAFGPTLGLAVPLPHNVMLALDGTVRYTHLNVDNYTTIPEAPRPPADRLWGSRNGVSWGGSASVSGPVTRVLDVRGSVGYLRNSIYENRDGNILMVTLGVALRPD